MTGGADAGGRATFASVSVAFGSTNGAGSPLQLGSPLFARPSSTCASSCGSGFEPTGRNENAYMTIPSSTMLFAALRSGNDSP